MSSGIDTTAQDFEQNQPDDVIVNRKTPVPEAMRGGFFGVLEEARKHLNRDSVIGKDMALLEARASLRHVTDIDDDASTILVLIERHLRDFPEEPKEGFDSVMVYGSYIDQLNEIIAEEHALYEADPENLRLRDPEDPSKYRSHILTECADGRNSATLFLPREKLLGRFDIEWLPAAGNILFPEVDIPRNINDVEQLFAGDSKLRDKMFERLDILYGPKVNESLAEYREGKLASIFIEFQSHYANGHSSHGCGAHKSNLVAVQLETIKNVFVVNEWLKNRHPLEFGNGVFKVFRTTHDTPKGGPIRSAKYVDDTLNAEQRTGYKRVFAYAGQHFESPVAAIREEGIIREYRGNPTGIETEDHDEQTIRISNLHFASTLMGQSVMEISWIEDPQIMNEHLKILLGIIETHFCAAHPDKPAILHFDLVKGDEKIRAVYRKLKMLLIANPEIKGKLDNGSIVCWLTETDRDTLETTIPSFV